jgi:prophage antirepressor-like protein
MLPVTFNDSSEFTFLMGEQVVRGKKIDGEPWFVANDVCAALDYGNPHDALSKHVSDEDLAKREALTKGGRQLVNYISEAGLYALLLRSEKPEARPFASWVCKEVLPAIRKHGAYVPQEPKTIVGKEDIDRKLELEEKYTNFLFDRFEGKILPEKIACLYLDRTGRMLDVDTKEWQRLLPKSDKNEFCLNATQLGKLINADPRETNVLLAEKGLQTKNSRNEWEPTEQGSRYGKMSPFQAGGRSGFQLLWKKDSDLIEILKGE